MKRLELDIITTTKQLKQILQDNGFNTDWDMLIIYKAKIGKIIIYQMEV